ncbi:Aromatic ring-opening dioxygenase, catalytic subunit, LigB family [Nitrosomonas ureae]|uniref:Aromatic ring-opening dioxygenase, catalytic subunit, LigB family n=1 Tax=Nitrosomonas ureae TaxID=44577 RepID=A0A285C1U0_9PROT|nr:class III extradiol ring-cleavage dioxygenase [Nitrosomonas ureae]SNX61038.1 Aromatic ring-opening dioxygenase, catalytic subunit, LigB family [Nitrosomonas ureae]
MASQISPVLSPVLFLPHGGGPLPILGDKRHEKMVSFLRKIASELNEPSAILVISAHWEEEQATITSGNQPEIIYDYYGFPVEAYTIQYAAPGNPELAKEIYTLLMASDIPARLDEQRGFDHGLFVPLKLMYPEGQIPCIQLSLLKNLDPAKHIALGKAIASIREKNILIIGSGMSFHNLKTFFSKEIDSSKENEGFNHWLIETCTRSDISSEQREQRLIEWEQAPFARLCHPREEHLLPLHVCFGTACAGSPIAKVVFNDEIMGKKVTSFLWQ